jgi:hypothetical protein
MTKPRCSPKWLRPFHRQLREVVVDNDDAGVTFTGTWSTSSSTVFYGTPGDVPYRFASAVTGTTPTAVARYPLNIAVSDHYPVYVWARSGSDRINQAFVVHHSGGTSTHRINLRRVGNGWIYIGNYYFAAGGNNAVEIPNTKEAGDPGTVLIADAVRAGNGMGSYVEAGATSGKPREEENGFYWAQESVSVNPASPVSPSLGTNWVSAPRELSEYMNREEEGTIRQRLYLSFHSNAAGATASGADGLFNSDPGGASQTTPNSNTLPESFRLAQLTGFHVNDTLYRAVRATGSPLAGITWNTTGAGSNVYGSGGNDITSYGEINNSLNPEMGMTIIEVAFHTNPSDVALMLEPWGRTLMAQASLKAVVAYFAEMDGGSSTMPPDPVASVRVTSDNAGRLTLAWVAPVASGPWGVGGGAPSGYVVYTSTDGYGFAPVATLGSTTTLDVTALVPVGETRFFRVGAVNTGGESFSSPTVGARRRQGRARVLIVDAFDRTSRAQNFIQSEPRYIGGTSDLVGGSFGRVWPRYNNSRDYTVQHGLALAEAERAFDSAQNEDVATGRVPLGRYHTVIWFCGEESTTDETFSSTEQTFVRAFVVGGGNLFTSGTELGWDLDRATGPTAADRSFIRDVLGCGHSSSADDDANRYDFASIAAGPLGPLGVMGFSDGTSQRLYDADFPDILRPVAPGATVALEYGAGTGIPAGIYVPQAIGRGRTLTMGAPFESILQPTARAALMTSTVSLFGIPDDRATAVGWTLMGSN